MDITLSRYEYEIAKYIGKVRNREAEDRGLKPRYGLEASRKSPLECHIMGCAGEMAVARALNIYWYPTVNTFSAADLMSNLQVRTRGRHDYDLIVRDADSDNDLFVLVTTSGYPDDLLYRVHGYMPGVEAKHSSYSRSHGGRPAAYFVPQRDLKPMSDLAGRLS